MEVKEKRRQTTKRMTSRSDLDPSRLDSHRVDSRPLDLASATLVVGLGRTGISCARYLRARNENIVLSDSREVPPELETIRHEFPGVPIHLGKFDSSLFEQASRIVVSPGVALTEPAIEAALEAGIPVYGDIELFANETQVPVVAITGSNGKSTVTTLVADMAKRSGKRVRAGGNLGPPALELLADSADELFVLELSSFQLETTSSLTPVAATVLNISPDHMDRYPDLASYAAAKRRVFRGSGVMVINRDDQAVLAMSDPSRRSIGFTLGPPQDEDFGVREGWLCRGDARLLPINELGLEGGHNVPNGLAALALGSVIGLDGKAMLESLARFKGLPHRCEFVAERDGVRWLNDSKATNIGATVAAVTGIASRGPVVLLAGGEGKDADFSLLRDAVSEVRAVILFGRDAGLIEQAIDGACPVHRAGSLRDAVTKAAALASRGDHVLLSPACASFDMFENYEARGEAFKTLVREQLS